MGTFVVSLSPVVIRRRLRKSVLEYGVFATIGRCLVYPLMFVGWRIIERTPFERQRVQAGLEFDRLYGVDTSRNRNTEWADDIDSDSLSEGTGFYPTPPDAVRRSIPALPIKAEDYVFIDLGSGKGRVMLVASEFPFKQCLGVEYDPGLHEVAVRNIAAFQSELQRCYDVQSYCHDATTFQFPEAPLVLFFAHPFHGSVLERFFEILRRSLRANPRDVCIIEYDPVYRDQFQAAGFPEIGGQDMGEGQFLPEIFYKLEWFKRHTFRNRKGKEFVTYRAKEFLDTAD